MILTAIARALGDLRRPGVFSVILIGILFSLALLIGLQAAITLGLRAWGPDHLTLPWIGEIGLTGILGWSSLLLFPLMSFFLMVPVAALFAGLFTDRVARAVETAHYPHAMGRDVPFRAGLIEGLAVLAAVVLVGIVTLILTPFVGPLAPVLFYLGNGWLLGREFFAAAAARHMPPAEGKALRQSRATQVTIAGVLLALLLTVPVLNIAIPVIATATFTHLFHLIRAAGGPSPRYPRG